jgi:hypothetical protein
VVTIWLETLCNLYGLTIKINSVTRVDSNTCIDNFLTNATGIFNVSNVAIADHQAIIAKININEVLDKNNIKYKFRQMKDDNWLCFKQGLNTIEIGDGNINTEWQNLMNNISNIVNFSFPLKEVKHKFIFNMSPSLLRCRDKKNRL